MCAKPLGSRDHPTHSSERLHGKDPWDMASMHDLFYVLYKLPLCIVLAYDTHDIREMHSSGPQACNSSENSSEKPRSEMLELLLQINYTLVPSDPSVFMWRAP